MTDGVTRLRRAHRYAEAADLIRETLDGAEAEVEFARIAMQREQYAVADDHLARTVALDPGNEPARAWQVALLSRRCRYAEAQALADAVLADYPDAHLVRIARGRATVAETGEHAALLAEVDAVLDRDPDNLVALKWRGFTLRSLGRHAEADQETQEALRRFPEAPELAVARGSVLATAGRSAEAIRHFDLALEKHPDYVDAHFRKTDHLLGAGHLDQALTYVQQVVGHHTGASDLFLVWGRALHQEQNDAEALVKFDRAVELDPDVEVAHAWRGFILTKLGRFDEAITAIREGLDRVPHGIQLLIQQAEAVAQQGEVDVAISTLERAAALVPGHPNVVETLVRHLRSRHRFAEAEAVALAGIEARPHNATLVNALGWVHAVQDRDEDALAWFTRAADLKPESTRFIVNRSLALRWLHRRTEADQLLSEACDRLPPSALLLEHRALTCEDVGAQHDALALYSRINEEWPAYVRAWFGRIRILRTQGRHAEAENVARTAIEANPHSADLRVALAEVQEARGDEAGAIRELRQACTDLPHSEVLSSRLAGLLRREGDFAAAWDVLSALPENATTTLTRISHLRETRQHHQAIELCIAALADDPQEVDIRLELGRARWDLDDNEAAVAEFDAVLAVNPTRRPALRGKVDCLRGLRRYAEAERILVDLIVKRPNYTMFRDELAWTLRVMGRQDEGIAEYERALEVDPRDDVVLWGYARALRLAGRWDDAERALLLAIERHPHDPDFLVEMGTLHDERNENEEALTWFDRALVKSAELSSALMAKSATLRSLGRFDQAERMLLPAVERPNADFGVVVEWGWLLRDRGQLTRARQAFERALGLAVGRLSRANVLHCLGWVAFTGDDSDEAVVKFREALAENPHSTDAKIGLAWTLVHERHANGEAEAERLCVDVLETSPRTHMAHTCLGVLYAHQGNLPQAEHHLRRSIEIDPYGGSYVDLGALFVQMDRFDEAEELLRKALERDWYDSQAHIELGGLHLQRDFDGGGDGADARQAAQHFRQALVIDPARGSAAIGLSLALIKSPGDLLAAERVLRDALRRKDCDQPRWQLLVALARLLIERGDATQRRDLHLEALSTAQEAIEIAAEQADPHYVAGIAAYKAGESGPEARARPFYRRRALRHFRRCLRHDPTHTEARRVMALAEQGLAVARGSLAGSVALMVVASSLLVALWLGFFLTDKVTTVVIGTLTPILVGLVALGFVLPFLVRLKLPGGVEADLSASLNQVTSGPTGEVSIGPGRLVGTSSDGSSARSPLSAGPRGELPRLG